MKRSKTTHVAASSITQQMMRSRSSASTGPPRRSAPNRGSISGAINVPQTGITPAGVLSGAPLGMSDCLVGHGQFQQPIDVPLHDMVSFSPYSSSHMANAPLIAGRAMDVDEFLLMREEGDLHTSPVGIPSSQQLAPNNPPQHGSNSGIPSVCGSMTSRATLETAPMSRVNSALNGQFHDMVRIESHQSLRGHPTLDGYGNPH